MGTVNRQITNREIEMKKDKPNYSDSWTGQDGRQWRTVSYWNGYGWQSFLQFVNDIGNWQGL